MEKIKLIIADDHKMVRQGLESIISINERLEVIATASNGEEVIEAAQRHSPNIILMDIVMPKMNGMEAAIEIKKSQPEVKILILSMEMSNEYIKQAFQNNIEGYLPKNADVQILNEAIESIHSGQQFFDQKVKDYIFKYYMGDEELSTPKIDILSEREVQVLKMISNGIPNKSIGEKLFISPKTVEAHRNNILKKLKLNSTADLVKYAIAKSITEIPKEMYN